MRIAASSYYWNFGFTRGNKPNLYCRLSPARPRIIERKKKQYAEKQADSLFVRELTANIWEDVTFTISKARGDGGVKISEHDFRRWLENALDLAIPPPTRLARTGSGDLIIDKRFSGKIYLKGLRVSGHSPDGREYSYGYNFLRGRINRDRERLMSRHDEAKMLAEIWGGAITMAENDQDSLCDRYICLFNDRKDCADIVLASEYVSLQLAKLIWKRLLFANADAFFYCVSDDTGADTVDQVSKFPSFFCILN